MNRRTLHLSLIGALGLTALFAQQFVTPHLGLQTPLRDTPSWDVPLNANARRLDTIFAGFEARHHKRGDLAYWDGRKWVFLPGNENGLSVLTEDKEGAPAWRPLTEVDSHISYGTPDEPEKK